MTIQEKSFSCYILLTDQISLPDCLYFSRYRAICVLQLLVNQAAMSQNLKLTLIKSFRYMTKNLNILRTNLSSNSVSIHQRHLRFLVTEIFKSMSQFNPEFMWSFFKPKKLSYNLRKGPILNLPRTQYNYYGTNAIHFRGSLIWSNIPAKVKSINSVFEFKTKVKNLGNIDCGCLICR